MMYVYQSNWGQDVEESCHGYSSIFVGPEEGAVGCCLLVPDCLQCRNLTNKYARLSPHLPIKILPVLYVETGVSTQIKFSKLKTTF